MMQRGLSYRYFGAAKQLPGVKELFKKDAPRQVCFSAASVPSLCMGGFFRCTGTARPDQSPANRIAFKHTLCCTVAAAMAGWVLRGLA